MGWLTDALLFVVYDNMYASRDAVAHPKQLQHLKQAAILLLVAKTTKTIKPKLTSTNRSSSLMVKPVKMVQAVCTKARSQPAFVHMKEHAHQCTTQSNLVLVPYAIRSQEL